MSQAKFAKIQLTRPEYAKIQLIGGGPLGRMLVWCIGLRSFSVRNCLTESVTIAGLPCRDNRIKNCVPTNNIGGSVSELLDSSLVPLHQGIRSSRSSHPRQVRQFVVTLVPNFFSSLPLTNIKHLRVLHGSSGDEAFVRGRQRGKKAPEAYHV